jgi:hypothetical protein
MKNENEFLSDREISLLMLKELKDIKQLIIKPNIKTSVDIGFVDVAEALYILKISPKTLRNWTA